jgi:UDP-2,3-diacylglucosamine hydrolase
VDPTGTVFFISDAHLGTTDTELEARKRKELLSFLEMVGREGEELYILGDLFDFWFEYGSLIPRQYAPLFSALWRLREGGVRMHYVVGNHDYWAGEFFERELGMKVWKEPLTVETGGKRLFLAHGDGFEQGDRGYHFMKRILRHRASIFLFGLLHPRLGFLLARLTSALTKGDYETKAPKASKALREYALARLQKENIDLFIAGHTHTPEITRTGDKYFVNLGDWIRHFTYAVIQDGEPKLMKWSTREEVLPGKTHVAAGAPLSRT